MASHLHRSTHSHLQVSKIINLQKSICIWPAICVSIAMLVHVRRPTQVTSDSGSLTKQCSDNQQHKFRIQRVKWKPVGLWCSQTTCLQEHYLNLISLLCSCFGPCHYQTHFPDSDPRFHLHFWHELTSWYKVWRIIIECIQGSRGVFLSGLNLMQSHLFNFTMREHPQV